MRGLIGMIGFLLMVGGAGNSDVGGDIIKSIGISALGFLLMIISARIGERKVEK